MLKNAIKFMEAKFFKIKNIRWHHLETFLGIKGLGKDIMVGEEAQRNRIQILPFYMLIEIE
jgi:hypothetical protein